MIYLCLATCAALIFAEYGSHARRLRITPTVTA